MLIAASREDQLRMPRCIMEQHERSAAEYFARTPDEPPRNQLVAVDRLAVAVDIETHQRLWRGGGWRCPQLGGPGPQGIRERLGSTRPGHLSQKPLGMPVTV